MASVIDLATYSYNLELNDKGFTSGMLDAENNTDKFESKMGKFSTFLKGAVVGGIASVGVALGGMGIKGIKSADELQQSLNNLSAQTGATAEETEKLEESLKNIYANNFGESFDDIAQSMATVNQTLGLTGKELENTTQNAIMMRDTFDMDVGESIDTVNALMANFGITAEQAYNLMAQGAQQGANKNGDLTDVLKEYAPHFAQLGLSAEEFTDTLIQGAKSGAFQVDKVGDAIKEFSIRSKDLSSTSAEGFELLGLNAEEMFNTFSQGGDGAEKAFQDVITKLGKMDDPLAQNTAGVALFGTMFEDLGVEGIKALGDIENYAKLDVDALGQINAIKYDSFGQALTGIGRNLETGILIPMGEKVLPIMGKFSSWIQEKMPEIQSIMGNAMNYIGIMFDTVSALVMAFIGILQEFYTENKAIFDGVAEVIKIAFDIIKDIFGVATALLTGDWEAFGDKIHSLTQNIFKLIQSVFNLGVTTIKTLLTNTIGDFMRLGTSIMNALFNAFKNVWSSIPDWISTSFNGAITTIEGYISSFYNAGVKIFTGLWDGIKSIWTGISSFISEKVAWIQNMLSSWFSAKATMSSGGGSGGSLPSYDVGINYVPYDQVALIHKGEAVIRADQNPYNHANRMRSSGATPSIISNPSITFNVLGKEGLTRREMEKVAQFVYNDIGNGLKRMGVR